MTEGENPVKRWRTASPPGRGLVFSEKDTIKAEADMARQRQEKLKRVNEFWDRSRDSAQRGSGYRVDCDLRRALEVQQQQEGEFKNPEMQIDLAIKLDLYDQASLRTQWKLQDEQAKREKKSRVEFTYDQARNISAYDIADWIQREMIPAFEKTKEEKPDSTITVKAKSTLPSYLTSFPIDRWIKNANSLYDSLIREASNAQ